MSYQDVYQDALFYLFFWQLNTKTWIIKHEFHRLAIYYIHLQWIPTRAVRPDVPFSAFTPLYSSFCSPHDQISASSWHCKGFWEKTKCASWYIARMTTRSKPQNAITGCQKDSETTTAEIHSNRELCNNIVFCKRATQHKDIVAVKCNTNTNLFKCNMKFFGCGLEPLY